MEDREDEEHPPLTDEQVSEQRGRELQSLFESHSENVAQAHKQFPVPDGPFHKLSDEEREVHNNRRVTLASANRAYWRAVSSACEEHRMQEAAEAMKPDDDAEVRHVFPTGKSAYDIRRAAR